MSDQVLTAAAIAIELGLPVLGLLLYWKLPLLRTKLIVILAALTPVLFFYAGILIAYALDPPTRAMDLRSLLGG